MGVKSRVVAVAGTACLALAGTLFTSHSGVQLVKEHEGRSLVAYLDPVGIPTICDGSTRNVSIGQKATEQECDQKLREDMSVAVKDVRRYVKVPITQRQFDALSSFVFNVGGTKFASSTLLKRINAGDCKGAAVQFDRWVYAGGTKLRGLVKRRAAERAYWEGDCHLWSSTKGLSTSASRLASA